MLRLINGLFIPVCDICGLMLNGKQSMQENYVDMANNNWLNGRRGTKWVNWCNDCSAAALQYLQEDRFDEQVPSVTHTNGKPD